MVYGAHTNAGIQFCRVVGVVSKMITFPISLFYYYFYHYGFPIFLFCLLYVINRAIGKSNHSVLQAASPELLIRPNLPSLPRDTVPESRRRPTSRFHTYPRLRTPHFPNGPYGATSSDVERA